MIYVPSDQVNGSFIKNGWVEDQLGNDDPKTTAYIWHDTTRGVVTVHTKARSGDTSLFVDGTAGN